MDPKIKKLADDTFRPRKADLYSDLDQALARQIQDHTRRGLLNSTVWLNARRELRQEFFRLLLQERITSVIHACEAAGLSLDATARAFLLSEINALRSEWNSTEDRKTIERLCPLRQSDLALYWDSVQADMARESERAGTMIDSAISRSEFSTQRDERAAALRHLFPNADPEHFHMNFKDLLNERVSLIKSSGAIARDSIKAAVDTKRELIITFDVDLPIEVGDFFERALPNGMNERFEILDPGYQAGLHGIPPSFQARVRRTTSPRRVEHQHNITYNVSGPNSRVNVGSTDLSTNVSLESHAIWAEVRRTIEGGVQEPERSELIAAIELLSHATDKPSFARLYGEFVALAANHMTILAPLLPQIFSLMP